jgi:translation initiation factor IF-3
MSNKLKEIKFRPRTEAHDLAFKTRHVREFLEKGHSVRLVVMFRGREIVHPDLGDALLRRVLSDVSDLGLPVKTPVLNGKTMMITVVPR